MRDRAIVRFRVAQPAIVTLEVIGRYRGRERTLAREQARFRPGQHQLVWKPDPGIPARTYLLRLTVTDRRGKRRVYGLGPPGRRSGPRAAIVRVLGVDAAFTRRSYQPAERAELVVATDARVLSLTFFQSGPERQPTYRNDELNGIPVGGDSVATDWRANGDGPATIPLSIGNWPSGLYFARLTADDDRVGFAPFVVRPAVPAHRVAVVLPTNTWQAYNFYDADGDGWGDTWYASWRLRSADLTRPYLNRGVPFRFRSYQLGFLHWLYRTGKAVDFYADDDLERFRSGEELAAAYDLIVFSGHEEYVTTAVYDLIERYRDLGGNLMFLSANNFFRRVDRVSERIELVDVWRDLGRPEARLCGVQYIASDRGERQAGCVVMGAETAPWAFEGTGLANGARFGRYGIEIDSTTPDSPPGTQVLARIPDLFGPGRSAEMTYYETPAGARVFSAGALNFGGQIELWPEVSRLLENLWARMSVP